MDVDELATLAAAELEECSYERIPQLTLESLQRYASHGIPTGSFLHAVLCNDLMGAVGRADVWNRRALFAIVTYIHNEMPHNCHGSDALVEAWLTWWAEKRAAERKGAGDGG